VCDALLRYDAGSELLAVFQRPYDVVVDTEQWHHLSAVIARFLKSRLTVGFASRPSRARLFDIAVPYKMNEHELDSFARLFQAAGLEQPPDLRRSFQIIASDAAWARDAVAGDYVVLALGASIMLRRFTLPQAESVCRAALERGFQVVLLGGMDVAALARQVMDRIKDPRVLHYAGRTSLSQTAAMIAGARRFIGHDTGLLHLACAVGTPVTGVFGPGNKFKWGPRGPDDRVISFNLSCSPCTRFGYTLPVCGGGYACVRKVAMDQASVS
jgi:ADP-heptose:LPS heptosyltransferase